MAGSGNSPCTFNLDLSAGTSFNLQVDGSVEWPENPYKDLYVDFPSVQNGTVNLVAAPRLQFWIGGPTRDSCERHLEWVQVGTAASPAEVRAWAARLDIDETGRSDVKVVDYNGGTIVPTGLFYLEKKLCPFNVAINDQGTFYACTADSGEIQLFYRLVYAQLPAGCLDVKLNPTLA